MHRAPGYRTSLKDRTCQRPEAVVGALNAVDKRLLECGGSGSNQETKDLRAIHSRQRLAIASHGLDELFA